MTQNRRLSMPEAQASERNAPPANIPEGKVQIRITADEVHLGDPGPAFSGTVCEYGDTPIVDQAIADDLIAKGLARAV